MSVDTTTVTAMGTNATSKNSIDIPSLRQVVRDNLKKRANLDDLEALDVEIGVYNASLDWADKHNVDRLWSNVTFVSTYKTKANSVLDNLDPFSTVKNVRLRDRLKAREFLPHDLAFMRPDQVFPERWQAVLETKEQRDDYIYNQKPEAMTDQFKCKKCHKRECVYYEQQMRSCDEPMSLFITCLTCGNRWRIG